MNEQVIAIFSIFDEIVKSFGISDGPQQKMTIAEIMTFAISPALSRRLSHNASRFHVIQVFQHSHS